VLGRAPVQFIGGLSLDSSGFGIAPDLDVGVLRARIEGVLDA
jgi:2-oxoglutarate/2-oxoacid ferredoxin oxidoreductase subunit alpha